jgi:hypothetical protein
MKNTDNAEPFIQGIGWSSAYSSMGLPAVHLSMLFRWVSSSTHSAGRSHLFLSNFACIENKPSSAGDRPGLVIRFGVLACETPNFANMTWSVYAKLIEGGLKPMRLGVSKQQLKLCSVRLTNSFIGRY